MEKTKYLIVVSVFSLIYVIRDVLSVSMTGVVDICVSCLYIPLC